MTQNEFINWLETTSHFDKYSDNSNLYWRELMNYAENIYDEVSVKENTVVFSWEEWYYGGIEYHNDEYSFEEFIERYNSSSLKNI